MLRLLLFSLFFSPAVLAQVQVTGAPVPLTAATDGLAHPRFSPDGRYVAFTTLSYDGLWVRNLQTGMLKQLTDEPAAGFGVSWSPDGTALLARVARFEDGRRENAAKVFEVESGAVRQLGAYRVQMPSLPAWSADASTAYVPTRTGIESFETGLTPVSGKNAGGALVVQHDVLVRADASGVTQAVADFDGQALLNVTPSPDGGRVAFEVLGGSLYVMNIDGSGLTSLGRGEHPSWSPDGAWIAFMQTEDDGHDMTGADLYAVRADGSARVQLTRTPDTFELFPTWTPDGAAIAFDDMEARTVYLLPVTY